MNRYLTGRKNKQQGLVLVIALILLLMITLLGVSAARMSSLDTHVAGNTIFSGLVFQGTESALGKIASDNNLFNVKNAATNRGVVQIIAADVFTPVETVNGGATLRQTGTIVQQGGDPLEGLYSSAGNSTLFTYDVFRVQAQSQLGGTSARDSHTAGRAIQRPKKTP